MFEEGLINLLGEDIDKGSWPRLPLVMVRSLSVSNLRGSMPIYSLLKKSAETSRTRAGFGAS
jgi:hypothetical protein